MTNQILRSNEISDRYYERLNLFCLWHPVRLGRIRDKMGRVRPQSYFSTFGDHYLDHVGIFASWPCVVKLPVGVFHVHCREPVVCRISARGRFPCEVVFYCVNLKRWLPLLTSVFRPLHVKFTYVSKSSHKKWS